MQISEYYLKQEEPLKSWMLAMKQIILSLDPEIRNELKYGMPFFTTQGKMLCYLWWHKKYQKPYLGLVDGRLYNEAFLIQEKRSRMKIFLLNPEEDLPREVIEELVLKGLRFLQERHKKKTKKG